MEALRRERLRSSQRSDLTGLNVSERVVDFRAVSFLKGEGMAFTIGRCGNVDYCAMASSRRDVLIGTGETFVCPDCGNPLTPTSFAAKRGREKISIGRMAFSGVAIVAVGAGYAAALLGRPGSGPAWPNQTAAAAPVQPAVAPAQQSASRQPNAASTPQPPGTPILRICGENGVTLQLAPRLAASILGSRGDTDISTSTDLAERTDIVSGLHDGTKEAISIATVTSAAALQALAAGRADIALTTRRVSQEEHDSMSALGDMTSPASEHVLALDAIAVVVNPANRVGQLGVEQLRAIYSGAVSDWSQLGGAPGPIDAWNHKPGSGTMDTFVKYALGATPMINVPAERISDDDGPIVAAVNIDRNAIAYISQANIGAGRPMAISDAGGQPLLPTAANIATEDYPLSRRLYLYTASAPSNPLVHRFTEYAESAAGQDLVGQAGFVSQNVRQVAVAAPATTSDPYLQLISGAQRLSVDFRFRAGSNDLDNRGLRDLDRVTDLLAQNHWASSRLMLIGFADNRGTPQSIRAIANERAQTVAALFANNGVIPGVVQGFGDEAPVGDNSTEDGREKNRRVEVYLRPEGSDVRVVTR
jgi:phosphate transport system substrate-binding protein